MLSSMMFTVTAQANNSSSSIGAWEPPKNFVDPATLKIQEFRSQGLNDDQITAKLTELGMGWDPKTGATWMGRTLTSEELAKMPDTTPAKAPSQEKAVTDDYVLHSKLAGHLACELTQPHGQVYPLR